MKPIAVIFVASGQGLIAVNKPRIKADKIGIELLFSRLIRDSSILHVTI